MLRLTQSSDLRNCNVFFSVFPEEKEEEAQSALTSMSKHIRHELARTVKLKYIPELYFKPDDSIKHSVDIYRKVEEIKNEFGSDS